jgi:hypothetical protein
MISSFDDFPAQCLFSFNSCIKLNIWAVVCRLLMSDNVDNNTKVDYTPFGKLPDHLLVEIFVRVPVSEWAQISCVKRQWANVFRGECLWQAALTRTYPLAHQTKRWPGPIPRGLSRRQV